MSKKSKKLIKEFKNFIKKAKIQKLSNYVKQSAKTDGVSEGGIYP